MEARATRWYMPDWVALILINSTSLAVAAFMLIVGAAIDRVFFNG